MARQSGIAQGSVSEKSLYDRSNAGVPEMASEPTNPPMASCLGKDCSCTLSLNPKKVLKSVCERIPRTHPSVYVWPYHNLNTGYRYHDGGSPLKEAPKPWRLFPGRRRFQLLFPVSRSSRHCTNPREHPRHGSPAKMKVQAKGLAVEKPKISQAKNSSSVVCPQGNPVHLRGGGIFKRRKLLCSKTALPRHLTRRNRWVLRKNQRRKSPRQDIRATGVDLQRAVCSKFWRAALDNWDAMCFLKHDIAIPSVSPGLVLASHGEALEATDPTDERHRSFPNDWVMGVLVGHHRWWGRGGAGEFDDEIFDVGFNDDRVYDYISCKYHFESTERVRLSRPNVRQARSPAQVLVEARQHLIECNPYHYVPEPKSTEDKLFSSIFSGPEVSGANEKWTKISDFDGVSDTFGVKFVKNLQWQNELLKFESGVLRHQLGSAHEQVTPAPSNNVSRAPGNPSNYRPSPLRHSESINEDIEADSKLCGKPQSASVDQFNNLTDDFTTPNSSSTQNGERSCEPLHVESESSSGIQDAIVSNDHSHVLNHTITDSHNNEAYELVRCGTHDVNTYVHSMMRKAWYEGSAALSGILLEAREINWNSKALVDQLNCFWKQWPLPRTSGVESLFNRQITTSEEEAEVPKRIRLENGGNQPERLKATLTKKLGQLFGTLVASRKRP